MSIPKVVQYWERDVIHHSRRARLRYSRYVEKSKIVKYLQDVMKAALLIQPLQKLRLI